MKFTELLAERKAVVELVDDIICEWIRFGNMPGYCKEYDPYKWYFKADKEYPHDENLDVFMMLCEKVEDYLKDVIDEYVYSCVDGDSYVGVVIQMLDEDKYHWSKNTEHAELFYIKEQERLKLVKERLKLVKEHEEKANDKQTA